MRSSVFSITFIAATTLIASVSFAGNSLSEFSKRIDHARELLGKRYKSKVIKKEETETEITEFVKVTTRKFLPKNYKSKATKVARTILEASEKFDLDPVFVMAVILNESSFYPKMKGSVGEIGLMQIKPTTAEWIAKSYKLKYKNADSLYDPSLNIWIGTAFIHKLRQQFDLHSQLYVSAYNIGAKKVRMMVSDNKAPKEYVQAVMKRYMALYAGYRIQGSAKEQSEIAWAKTTEITRKN